MKKTNKYDQLIEALATKFSNIKNFNLLQEDDKGKKIWTFITKRLAEIHSFKTLFTHYYLPAASKSVVDDLNELKKSKYKHLIKISREELKENFYDTIRLAYIGMFHKYENYVDDLILHAELLISDLDESGTPLTKYIEQTFQYRVKDWKNSPTISRLNWISNCNKHYDGYPLKIPKHSSYFHLADDEKMRFTKEEFMRDIELLISHYTYMLQTVFMFAMHKMTYREKIFEIDELTDIELTQKLIDGKKQMDEQVKKIIELGTQI